MRLFAGIPVPEPALGELRKVVAGLRERDWPVRWARDEGLHLTLKFYGQVPEERSEGIVAALREAAKDCGPIPMTCAGVGHFPPGRKVQIVWAGIDAPGSLELLQDRVERGSEALGFPLEGRPFRPHITLGRVRQGERLSARALAEAPVFDEIPFLADRVVLFESRPGAGGSVYTPRANLELA
jgi:2'-5' RNA ligase